MCSILVALGFRKNYYSKEFRRLTSGRRARHIRRLPEKTKDQSQNGFVVSLTPTHTHARARARIYVRKRDRNTLACGQRVCF